MADQEKKELNPEHLEVDELEDANLEEVSGGDPIIINNAAGCGVPLPKPPAV